MAWRRLSERDGRREPDGPYEGVPEHLQGPLVYWLETRLGLRGSQMARAQELLRAERSDPLALTMEVANRARSGEARARTGPVPGE